MIDITIEEEGTKAREELEILAAKRYLKDTDWYYARKIETSEDVPTDVVTKRLEARAYIREVEDGK